MTKKALGRGLDALISAGITRTVVADASRFEVPIMPVASVPPVESANEPGIQHIPLEQIDRNRFQPRADFNQDQLRELADSIRQRGVVQPLLVRPHHDDAADGAATLRFELIAGERRWRAAREAGLTTIPAIVRKASDQEALELALIENLQREDLDAIEEARAYQQLATMFQLTQEQIAEKVGRSRAAVANALRLLSLPEEVQKWIAEGLLSVGHAKAILGLAIGEEQRLVAERVLKRNLTVRETEALVEHLKGLTKPQVRSVGASVKLPEIAALEERLQQRLGTRVTVRHRRAGKGRIEIEYYNNDDLSRLLGIMGIENL